MERWIYIVLLVAVVAGDCQSKSAVVMPRPSCDEKVGAFAQGCGAVLHQVDDILREVYQGLEACVMIEDDDIVYEIENAPLHDFRRRMDFYDKLQLRMLGPYLKYSMYSDEEALKREAVEAWAK